MKKFAIILLVVAGIFAVVGCSSSSLITTPISLTSTDCATVSASVTVTKDAKAKAYLYDAEGGTMIVMLPADKAYDEGNGYLSYTVVNDSTYTFSYTGKYGKNGSTKYNLAIGVVSESGALNPKYADFTLTLTASSTEVKSKDVALNTNSTEKNETLAAAGSTITVDGVAYAGAVAVKSADGKTIGTLAAELSVEKTAIKFTFVDGLRTTASSVSGVAQSVVVYDENGNSVGIYKVTCSHNGTPIVKGEVSLGVSNNGGEGDDSMYTTVYIDSIDGMNCKALIDGLTVVYGDYTSPDCLVLDYEFDGSQIEYLADIEINGDEYGTLVVEPQFVPGLEPEYSVATGYVKIGLVANDDGYLLPYAWVTDTLAFGVYTGIDSGAKTVVHDKNFEELKLTCEFNSAAVTVYDNTSVIDLGELDDDAYVLNPSWIAKAYLPGASAPISSAGVPVGTVGTLKQENDEIVYIENTTPWVEPAEGNVFVEIWAVSREMSNADKYVKEYYLGEIDVTAVREYSAQYELTLNARPGTTGSVKTYGLSGAKFWDGEKWITLDSVGVNVELADGQNAILSVNDEYLNLYVTEMGASSAVAYVKTDSDVVYIVTCANLGIGSSYTVKLMGPYAPTEAGACNVDVDLTELTRTGVTQASYYKYEYCFVKDGVWGSFHEISDPATDCSVSYLIKENGSDDVTIKATPKADSSAAVGVSAWKCNITIAANDSGADKLSSGATAFLVKVTPVVSGTEGAAAYYAYVFGGVHGYK